MWDTRWVESNCLLVNRLAGFKFPVSPPVGKVGQAHEEAGEETKA